MQLTYDISAIESNILAELDVRLLRKLDMALLEVSLDFAALVRYGFSNASSRT